MGDPEAAGEDAVPELAGLDRDAGIALLDRAAGIGLLESLGGGYYQIHPALPWYFTTLYTTSKPGPARPAMPNRRGSLSPIWNSATADQRTGPACEWDHAGPTGPYLR